MNKKRKKSKAVPKEGAPLPQRRSKVWSGLRDAPAAFHGRRELRALAVVLAAAFLIRLIYFLLNKQNNPLFYNPIMDSLYHHEWANEIISGNFWGDEVFFRAPLYPYFLALLFKLSGSSIAFAIFCQHLVGTLNAGMTYVLSRLYFTRAISLLAGLLAAFYWPFLYFEADLLIVTLAIFLNLSMLILFSYYLMDGRPRWMFLSGILLGLSAIARPSILIFAPVVPVVLLTTGRAFVERWRKAPTVGRLWVIPTLLFIAGAAVVISPVLIRNFVVGRDFVPIASQGGVNFYIGNNPDSDGRTAIVPGTRPDWWGGYYDSIRIAEENMGRKLKPSEVSNYYFKKGFRFIFSDPGEAVKLFAKKFRLFWAGGERANNKNIYFFWHQSGMGYVPLPGFWLVAPLGLLGAGVLWRRRRAVALLYFFALSYFLGVFIFFVNARFRLPVVPILIIFASYAVFYAIAAYRQKSMSFLIVLLSLALLMLAVDADFFTFKENKRYADSISHYTLGNAYLKMGKKDKALAEYEIAYHNYQRFKTTGYDLIARNIDHNLGTFYWEREEYLKAIDFLERVGGRDRYAVLAKTQLADCYLKEGMPTKAVVAYHDVLMMDPTNKSAYLGLASIYEDMGATDRALEVLKSSRARIANDKDIEQMISRLENN